MTDKTPTRTPKKDWRKRSRHKRSFRSHSKAVRPASAMPAAAEGPCASCEKAPSLCVCAAVKPMKNEVFTLILRHPQEPDVELGTARIAALQLENSRLVTGLSWPSLGKILGQEVENKRWGILYLGTGKGASASGGAPITVLNKKGEPEENQLEILAGLDGIILLDGTWSQAKALWWRNAWMLKCRRLVLTPPRASLYGNLRKEPRRDSVSTIEAAAYTLAYLEDDASYPDKILPPFKLLLEKVKAGTKTAPKAAAKRAEKP